MKVKVQMHLRISWFRCDSMHEFMIHNGVSNCETNQIHPISKCEIAVLTFHQIRLDFICMLQFNANIFIVNCNEKAHSWCLAKKNQNNKTNTSSHRQQWMIERFIESLVRFHKNSTVTVPLESLRVLICFSSWKW